MKVVSKSVMRLTVLSIIFCVMIKPIYSDDMEEGVEQELVEDDLQEAEDADNDASMEEQSESDVELFDDGDDEDESAKQAALAAKKAEEEKKRELEQLKKATGQVKDPLEGIDDGVLGQDWVRKTLEEKGHWPPKELSFLNDEKFEYKGKMVSVMNHPGLRRRSVD